MLRQILETNSFRDLIPEATCDAQTCSCQIQLYDAGLKRLPPAPLFTGTLNRRRSCSAPIRTIVSAASVSGVAKSKRVPTFVLKGKGIHVKRARRPGTTVPSLRDSRTD